MNIKNILLIEGDGIGPEVVMEAKKILDFFSANTDKKFQVDYAMLGGIAYDKIGTPFPAETLEKAKKMMLFYLEQLVAQNGKNYPMKLGQKGVYLELEKN